MKTKRKSLFVLLCVISMLLINVTSVLAIGGEDVWADFASEKNIAKIAITKDKMFDQRDGDNQGVGVKFEITFNVINVIKGSVHPSMLTQTIDVNVGRGETYAAFDGMGNITNILMIGSSGFSVSGDNGIGPKTVAEVEEYIKKPYKLATQIYAKNNISIAKDINENLYSWGDNSYGQLGVGDTKPRTSPTLIDLPKSKSTTVVALGEGCVFAQTWDGKNSVLYAWGQNENGLLGVGDTKNRTKPTRVMLEGEVQSLAIGKDFAIAIMHDGNVYAWGANQYGQLGLGDNKIRLKPTKITEFTKEKRLNQVCCGDDYVLALGSLGEVYTWGKNDKGQLGTGDNNNRRKPVQIIKGTDPIINVGESRHYVSQIIADGKSSYIVYRDETITSSSGCVTEMTATYQLYGWGANNQGQLGLGDTKNRNKPQQILKNMNSIYAKSGSVYVDAFDDGEYNALAFGDNTNQKLICGDKFAKKRFISTPTIMENFQFDYMDFGDNFMIFTTGVYRGNNEDVLCVGLNDYGQLGDTAEKIGITNQYEDSLTSSFGCDFNTIYNFVAGENHLLVLEANGKIYCRGRGLEGQLGNGKTQNASLPQLIALP